MSVPEFSFFVHETIHQNISAAIKSPHIQSKLKKVKFEVTTMFQDPTLGWKDGAKYLVVFAPGAWLKKPIKVPDEAKKRILAGTARIIFWDGDATADFPLPAVFFKPGIGNDARDFLLNHVSRYPAWGLHTVLPPQAKILTERIDSEKQVALKIDQTIEFVCKQNPELKEKTLSLRLALTSACSSALAAYLANRGPKPPVFQVGVSGAIAALSIRWKATNLDFKYWQKPSVRWQAMFGSSLASVIQLGLESNEMEVLVLLDLTAGDQSVAALPAALDVLTSDRVQVASGLANEADQFAYEYFEVKSDKPIAAEFVSGQPPEKIETVEKGKAKSAAPVAQEKAAASASNPQIELAGLRVEFQKNEKQLKETQEKLSETTRKMSQAIDAEQKAQIQIKSLTSQVEAVKNSSQTQSAQEIKSLNVRLENAKTKETELIKKLNQSADLIKQLKSTQTKAG